MRKIGRIFFFIICMWTLAGSATELIPRAHAASLMTASESCIEFIKKAEGFSAKPYYDHNQHTVGYGTKCPTEKYFDYMVNGIPKAEAEALLREVIADVGENIHKKLIDKYNLSFTQYQFDALVSFTFNIGTGWMTYDSTLRNALLRNAPEDDIVYAFSLYSTASGNYSSGLIKRRLCEANMYLNGVYHQNISEAYGYVFYEPNGGSLTYQVQGFVLGNNSLPVAEAVKNSDVFLGWYSDVTGGTRITELNKSLSGKTLFARWQSSEDSDSEDSPSMLIHVTGDVVNIRKGPGTNYGISSQVYQNDILLVSHATKVLNLNWGKVQNGWICLEYTDYDNVLSGTGPADTVTAPVNPPASDEAPSDAEIPPDTQETILGSVRVNDLLRIRSGPGTTYQTVGYLFNGREVEIQELKTVGTMVWGRISRGWVSMDYIVTNASSAENGINSDTENTPETEAEQQTEPEQVTEPTQQTEPDKGIEPEPETQPEQEDMETIGQPEYTSIEGCIIADALRIRSGPGTANSIVGFYYQNDWVIVSETLSVGSESWGKTDKGWINMDYISTDLFAEESAPPDENGAMTVIADCLRVRKEIGTDSRIAALLYYGDTVIILETRNVDGTVWGRVDKGWICMDYVN